MYTYFILMSFVCSHHLAYRMYLDVNWSQLYDDNNIHCFSLVFFVDWKVVHTSCCTQACLLGSWIKHIEGSWGGKRVAVDDVSRRIRLNFQNLMLLGHENRTVAKVVVAGSVPPEVRDHWKRME